MSQSQGPSSSSPNFVCLKNNIQNGCPKQAKKELCVKIRTQLTLKSSKHNHSDQGDSSCQSVERQRARCNSFQKQRELESQFSNEIASSTGKLSHRSGAKNCDAGKAFKNQKFLRSDSLYSAETPMFQKGKIQSQFGLQRSSMLNPQTSSDCTDSQHSPSPLMNIKHQATFGLKAQNQISHKAMTFLDQEESKSHLAKSEELSEMELTRLKAEVQRSPKHHDVRRNSTFGHSMINKIVSEQELAHQFTAQLSMANKQLTGLFRESNDPKALQRTKKKTNQFAIFQHMRNHNPTNMIQLSQCDVSKQMSGDETYLASSSLCTSYSSDDSNTNRKGEKSSARQLGEISNKSQNSNLLQARHQVLSSSSSAAAQNSSSHRNSQREEEKTGQFQGRQMLSSMNYVERHILNRINNQKMNSEVNDSLEPPNFITISGSRELSQALLNDSQTSVAPQQDAASHLDNSGSQRMRADGQITEIFIPRSIPPPQNRYLNQPLAFIEENNEEEDQNQENTSSINIDSMTEESKDLSPINFQRRFYRPSTLQQGRLTPKKFQGNHLESIDRIFDFMSGANRVINAQNENDPVQNAQIGFVKNQLESQQKMLMDALNQNQLLQQQLTNKRLAQPLTSSSHLQPAMQESNRAPSPQPEQIPNTQIIDASAEYSRLEQIVAKLHKPICFGKLLAYEQCTPAEPEVPCSTLNRRADRPTNIQTSAFTIKEESVENDDTSRTDVFCQLRPVKQERQTIEKLSLISSSNVDSSVSHNNEPPLDPSNQNLLQIAASPKKKKGRKRLSLLLNSNQEPFTPNPEQRQRNNSSKIKRQQSDTSSDGLMHQNSGAFSQFTFQEIQTKGKQKESNSQDSSSLAKADAENLAREPIPAGKAVMTPQIARRGRNLIKTVKRLTRGQSQETNSELSDVLSLLQRKLVIKDMEEKKLLQGAQIASDAEALAKEKFFESQRKRFAIITNHANQKDRAPSASPTQLPSLQNQIQQINVISSQQPTNHLQVGGPSQLLLPLSAARSRRNYHVETNIHFNVVNGFPNDDFTPSHCNVKRRDSITTSEQLALADVSSQMLRQSDNTFNPDNYEYILVQGGNDTMSQHEISVSAPSISDFSNRMQRWKIPTQQAMQEWTNQMHEFGQDPSPIGKKSYRTNTQIKSPKSSNYLNTGINISSRRLTMIDDTPRSSRIRLTDSHLGDSFSSQIQSINHKSSKKVKESPKLMTAHLEVPSFLDRLGKPKIQRVADNQLSPILQESESYNTQNSSNRLGQMPILNEENKQEESKSSRFTSQEFGSDSSSSSASRISGLARPLVVEVDHLTSPKADERSLQISSKETPRKRPEHMVLMMKKKESDPQPESPQFSKPDDDDLLLKQIQNLKQKLSQRLQQTPQRQQTLKKRNIKSLTDSPEELSTPAQQEIVQRKSNEIQPEQKQDDLKSFDLLISGTQKTLKQLQQQASQVQDQKGPKKLPQVKSQADIGPSLVNHILQKQRNGFLERRTQTVLEKQIDKLESSPDIRNKSENSSQIFSESTIPFKFNREIKEPSQNSSNTNQFVYAKQLHPEARKSQESQYLKVGTHSVTITTISNISTTNLGKERINQYQIVKKIGEGSFSQVFLCFDVETKVKYAMKIMDKTTLKHKIISDSESAYTQVQREMAIMKKLDHPNVVKLFEIIDNPLESKVYLITEFVKYGTLSGLIRKRNLTDEQMRLIFRQLIAAVEYCHKVPKIIHRDIKPDNILIDTDGNVKLGDFGVSFLIPEDGSELINSNAGSDKFYSPEACMSKTYRGRLTDLWACGVTLYMMATGDFPFKGTHKKLYKEIQEKQQTYPPHLQNSPISDLIDKILIKQPEERITIAEIKLHPWLTRNGQEPMPELAAGQAVEFEMPTQEDIKQLVSEVKHKQIYKLKRKGPSTDESQLDSEAKPHPSGERQGQRRASLFGQMFTGLHNPKQKEQKLFSSEEQSKPLVSSQFKPFQE